MPLRPLLVAAALLLPFAAAAADAPQELTIRNHVFTPADIHVRAGHATTLHVRNADATPEEFDSDDLKVEKVIPGHATALVRLRPLAPGRYRFEGEYHEKTAHGVVVAE